MKSDEITLNGLEKAVLNRMVDQVPALSPVVSELTVLSRELTGAGSFTQFAKLLSATFDDSNGPIALDDHIAIPGLPNGLGALLFFEANNTAFLEIFSYGDDAWSGVLDGFSFAETGAINRT